MKRKRRNPEPKSGAGPQLAIIGGVLLLIAAVFVLKGGAADKGGPAPQDEVAAIPTAADPGNSTQSVPAAVPEAPAAADQAAAPATTALLPEAQLDQHLASGRPILAFFHSNTCVQCVQMTEIVEEVYPEFADQIALVDVNVYDEKNQNLLRRARIQVIPTVILIDRAQQRKGYYGVMAADALRAELETLAQEP